MTLRRHLFVERMIKQHNFPVHFFARQRFQLLKIAHADGIGIDSLRRSGDASAEGAQHDFLGGAGGLSGELREFGSFDATHPMRHHHFFQLHVAAERFHFARPRTRLPSPPERNRLIVDQCCSPDAQPV